MAPARSGQIAYHPNPIPSKNIRDDAPPACVYVPPQPTNRVLYLLHGVGDNEYSWEIQGDASSIVERIAESAGTPLPLVVMPFGFVTMDNKLNRRFPEREAFERYFFDLVDAFENKYVAGKALAPGARIRAVAGLSMGGKQALEAGLAKPELFTAIGAFSAAIQDRGDGSAVERISSLARLVLADRVRAPRLFCSCGTEDAVANLPEANRELHQSLAGIEPAPPFSWMRGGHEWPVWRRSLEEFLRFWLLPQAARRERRMVTLDPVQADSTLELVRAFAHRGLWPHAVEHPLASHVAAHYHRTDEHIQVTRGAITFFNLRNGPAQGITLRNGDRMLIPEGTVHHVRIEDGGVEYVMGLAEPVPLEEFPVFLPAGGDVTAEALADLVEINYAMAEAEEKGRDATGLFEQLLGPQFVFVGAFGATPMSRQQFIDGLDGRKDRGRRSRRLTLNREGAAVAATIVVSTSDASEFLNARLFERQADARWQCVRWSNTRITAAAQPARAATTG